MSLFTSSLSNTTITYHALNAFNLNFETDVSVKSESWGVMVEILTGENAGIYDFHFDSKTFIAA